MGFTRDNDDNVYTLTVTNEGSDSSPYNFTSLAEATQQNTIRTVYPKVVNTIGNDLTLKQQFKYTPVSIASRLHLTNSIFFQDNYTEIFFVRTYGKPNGKEDTEGELSLSGGSKLLFGGTVSSSGYNHPCADIRFRHVNTTNSGYNVTIGDRDHNSNTRNLITFKNGQRVYGAGFLIRVYNTEVICGDATFVCEDGLASAGRSTQIRFDVKTNVLEPICDIDPPNRTTFVGCGKLNIARPDVIVKNLNKFYGVEMYSLFGFSANLFPSAIFKIPSIDESDYNPQMAFADFSESVTLKRWNCRYTETTTAKKEIIPSGADATQGCYGMASAYYNSLIIVKNIDEDAKLVPWESNGGSTHYGYLLTAHEVEVTALDPSGSPIPNFAFYWQEPLHNLFSNYSNWPAPLNRQLKYHNFSNDGTALYFFVYTQWKYLAPNTTAVVSGGDRYNNTGLVPVGGPTPFWTGTLKAYGYVPQSVDFQIRGLTKFEVMPKMVVDISITNRDSSQVAAYTQLETAQKIYDSLSLYEVLVSKTKPDFPTLNLVGDQLDFGDSNVKFATNFYSTNTVYHSGDVMYYDDKIYECIAETTPGEAFTSSHWNAVTEDIRHYDVQSDTFYVVYAHNDGEHIIAGSAKTSGLITIKDAGAFTGGYIDQTRDSTVVERNGSTFSLYVSESDRDNRSNPLAASVASYSFLYSGRPSDVLYAWVVQGITELPTAITLVQGVNEFDLSVAGSIQNLSDSVNALPTAIDVAAAVESASLKAQDVRNAMAMALSAGVTAAAGSIDKNLETLAEDVTVIDGILDTLVATGFTLTVDERSAIATAVETAILNEADGKAVLDAIKAKISELDLAGGVTEATIVTALTPLLTGINDSINVLPKAQDVRDAMAKSLSDGLTPAAGSVDAKLLGLSSGVTLTVDTTDAVADTVAVQLERDGGMLDRVKVVTDKVDTTLKAYGDAGYHQFTAEALENVPSSLSKQDVRNAMAMALSVGTTVEGDSIDAKLLGLSAGVTLSTDTVDAVGNIVMTDLERDGGMLDSVKSVTDKVDTTLEGYGDADDHRFTGDALENVPSSLSKQDVRNAMGISLSDDVTPVAGSVDAHLLGLAQGVTLTTDTTDAVADTVAVQLERDGGILNTLATAGVTLTPDQHLLIAKAVETAILNETDGQAVLDAIANAIGNVDIDEVALVAAIRADLERSDGVIANIPTAATIVAQLLGTVIVDADNNSIENVLKDLWVTLEQDGVTLTENQQNAIASKARDYILSTVSQSDTPVDGLRSHSP